MFESVFGISREFLLLLLLELAFYCLADALRSDKPKGRLSLGFGFVVFGALAGGLSLLIVPFHLI